MTAIPFSRTLLCALLALALLPAAARADDLAPALPVPAADGLMATAHDLAVARWGTDPCGGQVQVSWNHMGPGINARSQWMSVDAHDPSTYSQCSISYNLDVDWDWPKLCTVVEHELGHLAGHDHVNDPHDVMSPYYVYPSAECSAAAQQAAPAPVAVAQSPAASSAKATKKAKKKASAKKRKASTRKASTRKASTRKAAARSKRGSARSKRGKARARAAGAATFSAY